LGEKGGVGRASPGKTEFRNKKKFRGDSLRDLGRERGVRKHKDASGKIPSVGGKILPYDGDKRITKEECTQWSRGGEKANTPGAVKKDRVCLSACRKAIYVGTASGVTRTKTQ